MIVSIDGVIVPVEAARISVLDRGLLYGDGCFEVLRTWQGRAREIEAHLDRLYATVDFLRLKAASRDAVHGYVDAALAAARAEAGGEQRIRIVLTRGPGPLGTPAAELGPGHAIVMIEPLPAQPTSVALAVIDFPLPARAHPGHKLLAYAEHIHARELARAEGADDGIRLDAAGTAAECAMANLFVVQGGIVITPPAQHGVLPGIVRSRVLALCSGELRIPVREAPLPLTIVRTADELFITSALRGVVGVTRLDGDARIVGPITRRVTQAYASAI